MINLSDLTDAVPATVTSTGRTRFGAVTIDSRKASDGDLFFALTGARDGHDFALDAVRAGAAGVVVERDVAGLPEGLTVVRVPDTLAALQALSAAVRRRTPAAVVAVTGSAGKTTTKDMATLVLASRFSVHSSKESFNNHLGLPLTLLGARSDHTHVVAEIGTNHRGEIESLARLAGPDIGIVTNVGFAHVGNFRSRDELAQEKTDLLRCVRPGGTWLVNGDDEVLMGAVRRLPTGGATVVTVGFGDGNTVRATDVRFDETGTTGVVVVGGQATPFTLPVIGRPFVYAALFALAVGHEYGIPLDAGAEALSKVTASRGRADVVRLPDGPVVVDDSYNASPDAMLAALDLLGEMRTTTRVAVLGEMRELGDLSEMLHRTVGEKAATVVTHLVVVGDDGTALLDGARRSGLPPQRTWHARSALDAGRIVHDLAGPDVAVLVKGSRFTHMERVTLGLAGRRVACALTTCHLYINCETCPKLEGG
jgi:UDP-N-acetylmuramoyl-tripeptide--D-alanyl-D-alanine ligase